MQTSQPCGAGLFAFSQERAVAVNGICLHWLPEGAFVQSFIDAFSGFGPIREKIVLKCPQAFQNYKYKIILSLSLSERSGDNSKSFSKKHRRPHSRRIGDVWLVRAVVLYQDREIA